MERRMNDLDKKRLAKLNDRHRTYSDKSKKHQGQAIELARESDKLFADFERFWLRQRGVK